MEWLHFWPQCCDSEKYLQLGAECAQNFEQCYHELRPMGSVLWFSLPYRLGRAPEFLILAHLILLVISVCLSSIVCLQLLARRSDQPSIPKWLTRLVLIGGNLLIHVIVLLPVLFNSLSDAPAALCSLIAVWLLLLNGVLKPVYSPWIFALSGLLLGCSAWIRVFYLYPLVVALGVFLIYWLIARRNYYRELLVLTALIPLALQFVASYRMYGEVSYLSKEMTEVGSRLHLENRDRGYDTLLPAQGHFWPSDCGKTDSLGNSICLIADKFRFYFGSYSPKTYMQAAGQRRWSSAFLFVNGLAMLATGYVFLAYRKIFLSGGLITIMYFGSIFGEELLIIPEQRFAIFVQTVILVALLEAIILLSSQLRALKKGGI